MKNLRTRTLSRSEVARGATFSLSVVVVFTFYLVAYIHYPESPVAAFCPTTVGESSRLDGVAVNSILEIDVASADRLCTLWLVSDAIGGKKPVARSYEGQDWEAYAGDLSTVSRISCDEGLCSINMNFADLESLRGYTYELTTLTHSISTTKQKARFLEQASFGPTRESLNLLNDFPSIGNWIKDQQENVPASSHRMFYRERLNHRHSGVNPVGYATHPCKMGTRFRRYAFSDKDWNRNVAVETEGGRKIFSVDGQVRTFIEDVTIYLHRPIDGVIMVDGEYTLCGHPTIMIPRIDGNLRFRDPRSGRCLYLYLLVDGEEVPFGIPPVQFDDVVKPNHTTPLDLDGHVVEVDAQYYSNGNVQEVKVISDLDDDICSSFPPISGIPEPRVIAGIFQGQYYLHDPRFDLLNNTIVKPSVDGGGDRVEATRAAAPKDTSKQFVCASAPRTFLNEDNCKLSTLPNSCSFEFLDARSSLRILLTLDNLRLLHEATGLYVYAIAGLAQDATTPYDPPCTPRAFSRWIPVDDCSGSETVGALTIAEFQTLLSGAGDSSPILQDVRFPGGGECDAADANRFDFKVLVGGQCWKNVHRDTWEVFDFTDFVEIHPGGAEKITQFAESGDFTLTFPSSSHPMARWYGDTDPDSSESREHWGTLGEHANYRGSFDRVESTLSVETIYPELTGATVVCGGHNEVINDNNRNGSAVRGAFDMITPFVDATSSDDVLKNQRLAVWMEIALNGMDQLRQRMAFALSQILVVSPDSIGDQRLTEAFLTYYDIFVRHAFGNYRDILKEVAYSPLMAEMLSYEGSQSTEYIWHRRNRVEFADENFAREIMQLFSIGLYRLNNDGTPVLDDSGRTILTYTNDDIREYARLWTGFTSQSIRGNIELDSRTNRIDATTIDSIFRDRYPKMGLDAQYVGDSLPLCADLPSKPFLRKGAKYSLMGTFNKPRLLEEPYEWASNAINITRFPVDSGSTLFEFLCDRDNSSSPCKFPATVVLDKDATCTSAECDVDDLRVVEVGSGSGIYYEHVRVPCVHQAFYDNPVMMKAQTFHYFCADPRESVGAVVCCDQRGRDPQPTYDLFSGERMMRDTAEARCQVKGRTLCDRPRFACENCDNSVGYWTSHKCTLKAKIDREGNVAIVHSIAHPDVDDIRVKDGARQDVKTLFRVEWTNTGDKTKFLGAYDAQCLSHGCGYDTSDNFCLCPVAVTDEAVFTSPPSREFVLKRLHIGAFNPDDHGFSGTKTLLNNGVTMYSIGSSYSKETVFKVVDENGKEHYRKNERSTVSVGSGPLSLSFRNPPHLISISNPEPREAHQETDAGLDHYFYHDNTAPFLAIRLCQRFGVSNPSPRYVETVANAFRSGQYVDPDSGISFGDRRYGNLGALLAAVLLDREAKSPILDIDPAHGRVMEPYLTLVRFMRSMEYKSDDDLPFVEYADNLVDVIGQQPHEMQTVFSFFLPDYTPSGALAEASLSCPECAAQTGPKTIALMNGLISLVKYGLGGFWGGLGKSRSGRETTDTIVGDYSQSVGHLTYQPKSGDASVALVEEMNLLLAGGRLDSAKVTRLASVYDDAISSGKSAQESFIRVQQLFALLPELHTNAISDNSGEPLPPSETFNPSGRQYKAFIFLTLEGGVDSWNLIVPRTCSGTNSAGHNVADQYKTVRGGVAFTPTEMNIETISTGPGSDPQPCSNWAIHDAIPIVKELYDAGDLLFVLNAGVVEDGLASKDTVRELTDIQLYAHNTMRAESQTIDPKGSNVGTGISGRISEVLTKKGYKCASFSIDEPSVVVTPAFGDAPQPVILGRKGATRFNAKPDGEEFDATSFAFELNAAANGQTSIFGRFFSDQFTTGIRQAEELNQALSTTTLGDHWSEDSSRFGERLAIISRLIQTRDKRGVDRDFFYLGFSGWDHHRNMKDGLREKFTDLNAGLTSIVAELKRLDIFNDVTLVLSSEFGRTLTPNSGSGTDHAWAGNYFLIGGDVKGGKMLGQYPSDLTSDGPLNLGRGRLLPTTSYDAIYYGIGEHLGASTQAEFDYILPNGAKATNGSSVSDSFRASELFQSSRRYVRV